MKKRILFRSDGNSKIGLGHIYRCLALREILEEKYDYLFLTKYTENQIEKLICSYSVDIVKIPELPGPEEEINYLCPNIISPNDLVVIDGYHFSTNYESALKTFGCKILTIDDLHNRHFVSDVIINHCPGITEKDYSKEAYTRLFLGPEYAIIRKRFIEEAGGKREIQDIDKVLICLGGADPDNFTKKIAVACLKSKIISELHILVGSAYSHDLSWIEALGQSHKIFLYRNLNTGEMLNLYRHLDLAIVSSSTIAFEVLSAGLNVVCGYYENNQKEFYQYLVSNKIVHGIGNLNEYDYDDFPDALNFIKRDLINYHRVKLIDGYQQIRLRTIVSKLVNERN